MAETLRVLLQLAAHGLKGVGDRHVNVRMAAGIPRAFADRLSISLAQARGDFTIAAHDQFLSWHMDINPDMIEIPLSMMAMGRFDHHSAARNAVEIFFQLFRLGFEVQSERF